MSSGSEGVAIATITANATDADAANSLTITQAGKPASLTFTAQAAGPSPRTATITEIGRASCREREKISVVAESLKKKTKGTAGANGAAICKAVVGIRAA